MRLTTLWGLTGVLSLLGCGDSASTGGAGAGGSPGAGGQGQGGEVASGGGGAAAGGSASEGGGGGTVTLPESVEITLVDNGAAGTTRVNFAVPLQRGQLDDASLVRVQAGGSELARASRGLASYDDGSLRSVQLQVEVDPGAVSSLTVSLGEAASQTLELVPVEDTLVDASGEDGPLVWALLPAEWLSASGVAGPLAPEAEAAGSLAAWGERCDYAAFDTEQFLSEGAATTRAVWLYDRGTVFYRGYARRGDLVPLASAYRESSMYRNLITGDGTGARNGLPQGSESDPKYQYAQNLAIHYLLTGDDRFRESAEDMALGMTELWPSPEYAGGSDSWTERNAGFALLAYVWGAIVSDDQAGALWAAADEAAAAYVTIQETYPLGYDDPDARCFAHHGDAHDPAEGNPYFGCSPWMSAILADALDGYARERGGAEGDAARSALIKLGRILARDGRDANDNPYYWMGVGTDQDAVDDYLEHIGESAYVIALAYRLDGATDSDLLSAAEVLVDKFAAEGEVGQLRSFNWQCRSAVMTPWLLSP